VTPNGPVLPEGAVIITPNEMYREMQDIGRKVDHLTSVIDPSLVQIQDYAATNRERIGELAGQVRALENWRWFVLGIAAIAAPAVAAVISLWINGMGT
jgi:tetrahydromethanopterin S-methyltransferase subunit B